MKSDHIVCYAAVCILIVGCCMPASCVKNVASNVPPAQLMNKSFLYEVMRHLYRWYMDERDLEQDFESDDVIFWVRSINVHLDEGDRSRMAKVLLPQFGINVTMKKADYTIEELDIIVSNDTYKITNVGRVPVPEEKPPEYKEIRTDYVTMRDYLFEIRGKAEFPDDALLERMRQAVREELQKDMEEERQQPSEEKHIVHLAPLSPVANEAWVFWENGRMLIRFASDIDLAHPGVWDHQELAVQLYDIDEQVVVSLDEVAGSNAYMTRDQVGRVLFNCIVLGRRLKMDTDRSPGGP